jgi:type IV pilus assembly protein PilA
MRTIDTAEVIYSSTYPATGFTCTLSDLDGFGGGQPNEHQAMLIPSGLASGKKPGYTLSLSGCSGNPVTSFHLVAVPAGGGSGRPAFCSDQSAVIRSSADGSAATCLASGTPVQ